MKCDFCDLWVSDKDLLWVDECFWISHMIEEHEVVAA